MHRKGVTGVAAITSTFATFLARISRSKGYLRRSRRPKRNVQHAWNVKTRRVPAEAGGRAREARKIHGVQRAQEDCEI